MWAEFRKKQFTVSKCVAQLEAVLRRARMDQIEITIDRLLYRKNFPARSISWMARKVAGSR